jgi:hypothetical protein
MAYLYGESSELERRHLAAHLAVCPDCTARVQGWRAATADLDAWPLPARRWRHAGFVTALRWATAAAAVLVLGFLLGRHSAPTQAEVEARLSGLRAELQQTRGADLRQVAEAALTASRRDQRELFDEFLRQFQSVRAEDRAEWLRALQQVDERRAADSAELREGLVTLAVKTGTGLATAENQVRWLATRLTDPSPDTPTTPRPLAPPQE